MFPFRHVVWTWTLPFGRWWNIFDTIFGHTVQHWSPVKQCLIVFGQQTFLVWTGQKRSDSISIERKCMGYLLIMRIAESQFHRLINTGKVVLFRIRIEQTEIYGPFHWKSNYSRWRSIIVKFNKLLPREKILKGMEKSEGMSSSVHDLTWVGRTRSFKSGLDWWYVLSTLRKM